MRVLFDDEAIHAWLPAGHFTLRRGGSVEWHTADDPLRDLASRGDDEVRLPRSLDPDILASFGEALVDAAVLSEGELAVVLAGTPPLLRVFEHPGGPLSFELPLSAEGVRVPGFDGEELADSPQFEGSGRRGIRLFDSPHGLVVAANESGHVAHVSIPNKRFGKVYRTPAAPEHDVSGRVTESGLLVSVVFNHRHIALRHLDGDGTLTGSWPEPDEVRWGTPPPVVLAGRVIAYSDEGPNAGALHVLTLPELEEEQHFALPEWPTDSALSADGEQFAFASEAAVTVGWFDGDRIAGKVHDVAALRDEARVAPPPRSSTASDDGRGSRRWFDDGLELVTVHRGVPLVRQSDRSLGWLRGDGSREALFPGRAGQRAAPDVLDARDGALLLAGAPPQIVDLATKKTRPVDLTFDQDEIEETRLLCARILGGGVFRCHRVRVDRHDEVVFSYWTPEKGARELARSTDFSRPDPPFAVGGGAVWYFTMREERRDMGSYTSVSHSDERLHRFTPATFSIASFKATHVPKTIVANGRGALLSVEPDDQDGEDAHERYLQIVSPIGKVERRPEIDMLHLEIAFARDGMLYAREPRSQLIGEHRAPDRLVRIDLATGKRRVFATAVTAQLSGLTIDDRTLWWLEGTTANQAFAQMIFAKGPSREAVSSLCTLSIDEI
jgi:hypothetical protein